MKLYKLQDWITHDLVMLKLNLSHQPLIGIICTILHERFKSTASAIFCISRDMSGMVFFLSKNRCGLWLFYFIRTSGWACFFSEDIYSAFCCVVWCLRWMFIFLMFEDTIRVFLSYVPARYPYAQILLRLLRLILTANRCRWNCQEDLSSLHVMTALATVVAFCCYVEMTCW